MTKGEMVYEIISNTTFSGLNERDVQSLVRRNSKSRVEEVYAAFTKDKEHASAYYWLLTAPTIL